MYGPAGDRLLLWAGFLLLVALLVLPAPGGSWFWFDSLAQASALLKGEAQFTDFADLMVGFRGLASRGDPYPILGPALEEVGVHPAFWGIDHATMHPPWSFLLAAPVARWSWPAASACWAWAMVACLALTLRLYGLSWRSAVGGAPLLLLWPPASASLGQLPILWALGAAAGWRWREERPGLAGAGIALASLTKYFPAILLLDFAIRRRKEVVGGFLSVWVAAVVSVVLLHPGAIARYLEVGGEAARVGMNRADNASTLFQGAYLAGWPGVAAVLGFYAAVAAAGLLGRSGGAVRPDRRWWVLTYLSVSLLPVSWLFSMLPLLPCAVHLASSRRRPAVLLCAAFLAVPCLFPPGRAATAPWLAGANLLLGLAFIVEGWPGSRLGARTGRSGEPGPASSRGAGG